MSPCEQQLIKSVQQSIKNHLVTRIDETEAIVQSCSHGDEMGGGHGYVHRKKSRHEDVLQSDPYREKLLTGMGMSKDWAWPWKIVWVPLDDDFIYLAYRVILQRDPDLLGFLSFQGGLAKGMARVGVLIALSQSQEAVDSGRTGTSKGLIRLLDKGQRFCKRMPLLQRFCHSVWLKGTGQARMMRLTLILQKAREDLVDVENELLDVRNNLANSEKERTELTMKIDDVIEYFNNQRRNNISSAFNGNPALSGKCDHDA